MLAILNFGKYDCDCEILIISDYYVEKMLFIVPRITKIVVNYNQPFYDFLQVDIN